MFETTTFTGRIATPPWGGATIVRRSLCLCQSAPTSFGGGTRAVIDKSDYGNSVEFVKQPEFPTVEVFNSYNNKWEDIVEVSDTELNGYEDNDLIQAEGDHRVYKLKNRQKRWIKTAQAFNRLGYDWSKIASINQTEFNVYQEGTAIE